MGHGGHLRDMQHSPLIRIRLLVLFSALTAGVVTSGAVAAQDKHSHDKAADHSRSAAKGQLIKVDTKTDAAWLAKAKAEYPTDVCVVSGDKLGGDMGLPQDYIYREEGNPDRLVRLCCKDCLKDLKDDPAKVLGKNDDAAAKKSKK